MAYDLYPPPSLKPCEPVDTIDTRYLSQSHAFLTNPLKKALHLELYNEKWYNKPLLTSIPPFTYHRDTLKMTTEPLPSFPSVIELREETHSCLLMPLFEKVDEKISNLLSLSSFLA